jgi:5S rRNA maturation endonuclease (ribonuclease M5)
MAALAAIYPSVRLFFSERFHSRLNFLKTTNTKKPLPVIGTYDATAFWIQTKFKLALRRAKSMYDNFTPNDGQTSSSRGNLVPVTKSNPCPHCGKPDWCYSIGELSVCNRDQPPATGWEATSKTDKDGKIYYAPIQQKKAIRPRQTRYWEYRARDGSPLVRVVRFDDGEGGKPKWSQQSWGKCKRTKQMGWIGGTEGIAREDIPIYRYAEVRKAIANNELIFIAEGEDNVDRLWALGFAATCNIGGSGKWRESDTRDLQGAKVVIIPDRDEPGINHTELLHQQFPKALWLYPFPNSKAWENLPKSKGLDIADWIEYHQITADDIKVAVGEKKVFNTPQAANVIRPPQFYVPQISELGGEIETLLQSDLKKSQLQLKVSELAQKFRMSSADVWKIYREREQELEQEANQEGTATEVAQLLASKFATLNLTAIFPSELAEAITRLAQTLNIKPECYALALLTQVSTLLKPGTRTMLYPQTNFRVCPNFFGALIAESSQKKTPIIRAIITDPMEKLNAASRKAFKEAEAAYEEELNAWTASKSEDKGPKPQKPARRVYYITTATGESIPKQAARVPDQSLMWVADELAGMLKSPNQYRSGKGADEENLLEYWSGGGAAVLRADGLAVDAPHVGLSIFGNIQPKVLAQFLGDGSDDNGKFARFELIQQPLAATELFEDAPNVDLTLMLSALYEHLDPLPPQNFQLDTPARKLFIAYYNQCERDRVTNLKQGMRAMLGKAPEKVGKVATILHVIHGAFRGGEIAENIPVEIVRGAIQFVNYTTDQALSVNLDICESSALAPNLAKIVSLAERNGGTISGAKIAKSYNAKLRPTNQEIREWLDQLASMKYGEVTSSGRNISFTLSPQSPTSPLSSKPYTERLESVPNPTITESPTSPLKASNGDEWGLNGDSVVPIPKSLSSKGLKANGDYGDSKNHFSENSDFLMLGCTTKPEEFAGQIRKAITNFDQSLAIQILNALKGKAKEKLREEVKSHLTYRENENFRLLVVAGFLLDMRVKYVGDSKYAEQYEGLELQVYKMDEHFQITCRKPDGYLTTRMKPEELEKL